jgi:hypothetical protein
MSDDQMRAPRIPPPGSVEAEELARLGVHNPMEMQVLYEATQETKPHRDHPFFSK